MLKRAAETQELLGDDRRRRWPASSPESSSGAASTPRWKPPTSSASASPAMRCATPSTRNTRRRSTTRTPPACARSAPTATCRRTGRTRSSARSRRPNELWHKIIGTIDTPEKFQAQRASLAKDVWKTMKETDSRECRNCHSYAAMDFDAPEERRRRQADEEGPGGRPDLHRLPQGHRPQAAGHEHRLQGDLRRSRGRGEDAEPCRRRRRSTR